MRRDIQLIVLLGLLWALGVAAFALVPRSHPFTASVTDPRLAACWRRIQDPAPMGVVFLGSSRTMSGLDTPFLSERLGVEAVNLASNWYGPDLWLSLGRGVLESHRPALLVVEIDFLRHYHGHVNFKSAAPLRDVLAAPPSWETPANLLYSMPRALLQGLRWSLGRAPGRELEQHGFLALEQPPEKAHRDAERRRAELASLGPISGEALEPRGQLSKELANLALSPQLACYQELRRNCEEHGARLLLLPLPKFRVSRMTDERRRYWRETADLLELPPDLLDDPTWWFDPTHLNPRGARVLAEHLEPRLRVLLNEGSKVKI